MKNDQHHTCNCQPSIWEPGHECGACPRCRERKEHERQARHATEIGVKCGIFVRPLKFAG